MSQSAKKPDPQAVLQFARRGRARPAGDDTGNQVAAILSKAGFSDSALVLRWRDIVGADVARIAQPTKLSQGPEGEVLTLRCEPGAAVFLQHETRALLQRINAYLGSSRVVRLKLISGQVTVPKELDEHPGQRIRQGRETQQTDGKPSLSEALAKLSRRRSGGRRDPPD